MARCPLYVIGGSTQLARQPTTAGSNCRRRNTTTTRRAPTLTGVSRSAGTDNGARRARITVHGVVQGVGFRPFVYRLARDHGIRGWVKNRPDGVCIEAQGASRDVGRFVQGLSTECPSHARVVRVSVHDLPLEDDDSDFRILDSSPASLARATLPADIATCPECAAEIDDPQARRFEYPFTNCTYCGPRYSIVGALPYDRDRTSMAAFRMCPACRAEYDNPLDRRFHAQPIACPDCGPRLRLVSADDVPLCPDTEALDRAAEHLQSGRVLALKGLGGFQLLVDATDAEAVQRLRARKQRDSKPFAVMFPSVGAVAADCELDSAAEKVLTSAEAPILLLRRRPSYVSSDLARVVDEVAPRNPWLGVLLPYTPLHRVLMRAVDRPVICTSGNLTDEPMCIANEDAFARLGSIADVFLVHDRGIVRPVDDSLARMAPGGSVDLLRRARGYAPLPLHWPRPMPPALALGGQLKSTLCLTVGDQAILSQHLGDVGSAAGASLLERTVHDLTQFFGVVPQIVACDRHPDYASTRLGERLARQWNARLVRVQHHHAHVAACMAEAEIDGEVLGLAWDGTGWGDDGTIWGGEALVCERGRVERIGSLRPFPLVGGDAAAREPRRAALGLLHAAGRRRDVVGFFAAHERSALEAVLDRGTSAVLTSSIGRLFDAVAALVGLCGINDFEGQAAMELEFAADSTTTSVEAPYPIALVPSAHGFVGDFDALVGGILADLARKTPTGVISARFHAGLAEFAAACARRARKERVVLTGGCFQNRVLTSLARECLERDGFDVVTARAVPCNDGGLSLGQMYVAAYAR